MAIDIPQQSQEKDETSRNQQRAQGQAEVQAKSGNRETVGTDEYQRRWIGMQERQRENQRRLAEQGAIKDAKERREQEKETTTAQPKKKFLKGMGKYLIPTAATGGGIIGAILGLN